MPRRSLLTLAPLPEAEAYCVDPRTCEEECRVPNCDHPRDRKYANDWKLERRSHPWFRDRKARTDAERKIARRFESFDDTPNRGFPPFMTQLGFSEYIPDLTDAKILSLFRQDARDGSCSACFGLKVEHTCERPAKRHYYTHPLIFCCVAANAGYETILCDFAPFDKEGDYAFDILSDLYCSAKEKECALSSLYKWSFDEYEVNTFALRCDRDEDEVTLLQDLRREELRYEAHLDEMQKEEAGRAPVAQELDRAILARLEMAEKKANKAEREVAKTERKTKRALARAVEAEENVAELEDKLDELTQTVKRLSKRAKLR